MGNFARKIIDAVQNSLLDKLVARLFPIAPVTLAALPRPETYEHFDLAASIVGLVILGGIAMWVIGFIANRRPRPGKSARSTSSMKPRQTASRPGANRPRAACDHTAPCWL